jgi:hypothetical protein
MITTLAFFFKNKKILKETLASQKWGEKKLVTIARFPYLCDFQYIAKNILEDDERFVLRN